MPLKGAGF
jgi:hypothetical protein